MNSSALRQWQTHFKTFLIEGSNEDALAAQISTAGMADARTRLQVYRNAYYMRLEEALAYYFPVLLAVLGEGEFGRHMAAYIRACPSTSPSVRDLGDHLCGWLERQGFPLWADLAALEWAALIAFDAADAPALSPAVLAALPAEQWPQLHFRCSPSLSFPAMNSNALSVWRAVRAGRHPPQLKAATSAAIVVWRYRGRVMAVSIDENERCLLDGLRTGESLETICDRLPCRSAADAEQIVATILQRAFRHEWLVAIDLR